MPVDYAKRNAKIFLDRCEYLAQKYGRDSNNYRKTHKLGCYEADGSRRICTVTCSERNEENWRRTIAAAAPPPPVTCPRGNRYNIHFYETCAPGYTKKFDFSLQGYYCLCDKVAEPPIPTPPVTPPVTPPPTPPPIPPPIEECPRGSIYTRSLFRECDPGYYQGDIPGAGIVGKGMACICAKEYVPPHLEPEKPPLIPGIPGLEKIFEYLPIIIGAGVLIAVLGLLRK